MIPPKLHQSVHRCKWCDARIVWANEGTLLYPVDADHAEDGNLILNLQAVPKGTAIVATRPTRGQATGLVSDGETLHHHHMHTCTGSGEWYRKVTHGPARRGFPTRSK